MWIVGGFEMCSSLSKASVVVFVLAIAFLSEARAQPPVTPADEGAGHMERPNQPPARLIGPRQVSPPPSCEFLSVNGFTSVQVNLDEDGNNILDDAANETTIAVNPLEPDNIVIGWRQFDSIDSDFRQSGIASSHDGGLTWTNRGPLQAGTFGSDPVVGVDAEGVFYYVGIDFEEVRLFRSFNGGVDWDPAIRVIGAFRDKEWFTIDPTDGIGRGHLYMTWSNLSNFTRSTDGGETWMTPIQTPLGRTVWGTLSVGPDGELYIVDRTFRVARSDDAQNAARAPTFPQIADVSLGGDLFLGGPPNPGGLLGQPWIKTDHSDGATRGNVYLLCTVSTPSDDPLDVKFARSTDGGLTWTDPIRVNDDPEDPDAWQWFGAMDVAPSGRIDAVWYDTRNSLDAVFSEAFYAYSTDAGDTWSSNMLVAPVFNSTIGWPRQNKIGDYIGVISDAAAANVAYAATYNGEQDVYFLRIEIDCNQNGVHDGDDIARGTSEDDNGNGVPDECESGCLRDPAWQCDGDVDGDGQVNPVDSGLVQAAFCGGDDCSAQVLCQYDMDCDGQINPVDSGIVQSLFGTCDAPRNVCP
jgi:hypothetical protein